MRWGHGRDNRFKAWFLVLAMGGFWLLCPHEAWAGPCWANYPAVPPGPDQPIAGFPKATDFKLPGDCVDDAAAKCTLKGMVAVTTGKYGCGGSETCCLAPSKVLGCFNDYQEADRVNIQSTTCVKTAEQCASANKKKLGDGHNCTEDKGGTICCATMAAGATAAGTAIPKTGSTAEWKFQNKERTGILLVPCTQDGNCEIKDLVQQGINFAKWLMGLAGALFLLVFVYGGAMYLASFGNSAWVTKGKNALTRGAIGIVLVMGAWTIVWYVASSLGYTPVPITAGAATPAAGTATSTASSGGGGTCVCSGTVTAAIVIPDSVFDSYCPDVKQYCSSCGGGKATCSITLSVTQKECESNDFGKMAQQLGIPSPALDAVELSGNCKFTPSAAGAAK